VTDLPASVFAKLTSVRRIWAIGSIHGEVDRLRQIHLAIGERFRLGDRFVYLGNYLGHGPAIAATLDELVAFRRQMFLPGMEAGDFIYLRGSQEEMWRKLLQLQFATGPSEVFEWMVAQGLEATLRAYGGTTDEARKLLREGALTITRWTTRLREAMQAHPGHDELLSGLHRAAYTEDDRLVFVHAGLDPERPLTEQGDTFWWGSGYFDSIAAPYFGASLVVRGYDRRHRGVLRGTHTLTVDAGAGFGGRLAAICLAPDGGELERLEA
jgi:serine/threonine protein phosphatase 1